MWYFMNDERCFLELNVALKAKAPSASFSWTLGDLYIYTRARNGQTMLASLCKRLFLLEVRAVVGDISLLFDEAKSLI